MKTAGLAALFCIAAGTAGAGPIERACLKSDQPGASSALCGCIQGVADITLSGSDQQRAAKFFTDPDAAQKAKALDSQPAEAFWGRYENFGATAEAYCAAG